MIDRCHIGTSFLPFTVGVEASRLRFFAKATGQTDPVYSDPEAALAAGYPGLPVPPTFLFCLEMDAPNPAAIRQALGLDLGRILHGEQGFTYHRMVFAGERLTFCQRIDDIYDKKGGALEFIVRKTDVIDAREERVAELRCITVYRHPAP
jgi:acyl dehydratase